MKNFSRVILALIAGSSALWLLASAARTPAAQDSEVQYQRAVQLETIEGNLNAAIDLYKQVINNNDNNRAVAAKALLRLGGCYEKQGNAEASKAYEKLLRDYADQAESAAEARTRLAAMRKPSSSELEPSTRQVWIGPDLDIEGSPSPDGKYLSFVDWDTGDLAIRNLETGKNRRLTNKGPWEKSEEYAEFSRWSPDGKQIAYDWYDGKCCTDLHVIAPGEGKPRVLIDYNNDEWMQTYDWTPDSKQILIFVERENGTRQIVLVSAADGVTKVVKTFEQRGLFPQTMRISRDGEYIAYDQPEEENGSDNDIFLLSVDGKHETRLVKHPADDRLVGWSPDGKGVFFASDRTGSVDMWYLPVSGGKAQGAPEFVKGGLQRIIPMGLTQNGSFFYAQGVDMLDVYVATMDPRTGKILNPPEKAIKKFEGSNSWPDYSFDGKYLAYLTTRSHSYQANRRPNILCIRELATGKEREFTTKFRRLAGTRWAPDGKSLYLAAWDSQGHGHYKVDA
jgi:Tol biopolymer transport system component